MTTVLCLLQDWYILQCKTYHLMNQFQIAPLHQTVEATQPEIDFLMWFNYSYITQSKWRKDRAADMEDKSLDEKIKLYLCRRHRKRSSCRRHRDNRNSSCST